MSSTPLDTQNIVPGIKSSAIDVVHLRRQSCGDLHDLLEVNSTTTVLGVAYRSSARGLETIALATSATVFVMTVQPDLDMPVYRRPELHPEPHATQTEPSLEQVFSHPRCLLAGTGIARTALLLHRETDVHVHGVELLALPTAKPRGKQVSAADVAFTYLGPKAGWNKIHALWQRRENDDLCLRAWVSACIADKALNKIEQSKQVNTSRLPAYQLRCLSQLVLNVELLEAARPHVLKNEFEGVAKTKDGFELRNERYKNRIRRSNWTVVDLDGKAKARVVSSKGRMTEIRVVQGEIPPGETIDKVYVLGREESTCAELARDEFVLGLLQGDDGEEAESARFLRSEFVRMLWFSHGHAAKKGWGKLPLSGASTEVQETVAKACFEKLNTSQHRVAMAMIAQGEPLVIARGPPGTGKTSTIAAALQYWQKVQEPAWVVAHSNVGVQNIAISLSKRKIDFKIIVSKEFHFEWHEHLYADVEHHLIRSDVFDDSFDPRTCIGDTKVILCTLSMLSNPALDLYGIYKHVPVERLIVDEASQIDTFEFMHLFDKFSKTLQKVCMFGDPHQLPPYGKTIASKIKTIFDMHHFQHPAYFLDTQYRMPVPLGDFISKEVYRSKLKSVHDIQDSNCVLLVDVRKGAEEHAGQSWKNTEEANTIVNIVTKYYSHAPFCVITPYDAQRATLTAALKAANVKRYEHVYNVDSFQGHEAAVIIVSAVRTGSPGFLRSLNRMNVMLTRCQEAMVVVTQRKFLRGAGKVTLLGKLARHWEDCLGESGAWVDAMDIAGGRANLPPGVSREQGGDASTSGNKGEMGADRLATRLQRLTT